VPPSLARQFYDRITTSADPVAAIRGLINPADPTFETDWLDFKGEHDDPKYRDASHKATWFEALSEFSNNQGGVLVWGVDARKTKNGDVEIDAASEVRPVLNPLGLKSRLIELQRGATDPRTANVEIEAYDWPMSRGRAWSFVTCRRGISSRIGRRPPSSTTFVPEISSPPSVLLRENPRRPSRPG
jgi:hypothetical protein